MRLGKKELGSMGVYVCEFEFVEDGDMVLAWPFWPGYAAGTEGCGLEDAVAMAADWLRIMVLDCLAKGEAVPACGFGHARRQHRARRAALQGRAAGQLEGRRHAHGQQGERRYEVG